MPPFLPAIATLLAAVALAVFTGSTVRELWRPDAFDYAQIARELHAGNGFTTRQAIYLLHLEFLERSGGLEGPWPNLHRFPLPPIAIASSFALFGVGTTAVSAYGVAFHALTAGLIFAWGRQVGGLAVACASWLLVTGNAALLQTSPSGLAEPPEVFFFTLALYLLWRFRGQPGRAGIAAAGAALGLAALARTNALFAAPVLVACLLVGNPDRWRQAGLWLAGVGCALAPWLVRNAIVTGDPFFSLHSYFLLPAGTSVGGDKWDLQQPWVTDFVSPLQYFLASPGPVLAKWFRNLTTLLQQLPTLGETFLLPLCAAAALLPVRRFEGLRAPAVVLFAAFALHALLVSFTDIYFDKYHFQFLPGLILLAAATLWRALEGANAWRGPLFAAGIAVMLHVPAVLAASEAIQRQTARFDTEQLDYVRAHTSEDDLVLSDFSYAVAWHTGRRSIRTHYDTLEGGESVLATRWIEEHYLPVDAIYLSREFVRSPRLRRVLRDTLAKDPDFRARFPVTHQFEDGALFFASSEP